MEEKLNKGRVSKLFFSVIAVACWGYGMFVAYGMGWLLTILCVIIPPFGMLFGLYAAGSEFTQWIFSFATWKH